MNRFYDEGEAKRHLLALLPAQAANPSVVTAPLLSEIQLPLCNVLPYEQPEAYRLTNTVEGEAAEVTVRVPGILCSKMLPPVTRPLGVKSRKHVRNLRQFVRLTGLGLIAFDELAGKIEEINAKFRESLPTGDQVQGLVLQEYEGEVALDMHSRYFTDRAAVPGLKHIPLHDDVDPLHILEGLRGPHFIHAPENEVQYCRKVCGEGDNVRYQSMTPANFGEGDVVEAHVALVAYPLGVKNYKMVMSLRTLALISSECRERAEVCRQQALEEAKAHQQGPKRQRQAAAGAGAILKRRYVAVEEVGTQGFERLSLESMSYE
ncbi:hypothetical protein MD484_g8709, partial [Candolleomyces efflorescens]